MKYRILFSLAFSAFFITHFTSCEKKEDAITLPPRGPAVPGRVTMGENYDTQVFYDFESNSIVKTSDAASWDLAFETGKEGSHIWLNGGKGVQVRNTQQTNFNRAFDIPSRLDYESWSYDSPTGDPAHTGFGDWRNGTNGSKGEIYLVSIDDTSACIKMRLVSVNDTAYQVEWGHIGNTQPQTVWLKKNDNYNFIYFSFTKGIVQPEPEKDAWDVVFTRYCHIYTNLDNFPYLVNGVLLNPGHTTAAADSSYTYAFADIDRELAATFTQSSNRDVIGFNWKAYNFSEGKYAVDKRRNYILRTRNGQVHKLRFLDFYSLSGVKGSPSFESERLQ